MKRRNCCMVIKQMMKDIPDEKTELIKDLIWNYEDAYYKAPEETIQWERTMNTLIKHIPNPKEDWEFKILSIFTTKSIAELQISFNKSEN